MLPEFFVPMAGQFMTLLDKSMVIFGVLTLLTLPPWTWWGWIVYPMTLMHYGICVVGIIGFPLIVGVTIYEVWTAFIPWQPWRRRTMAENPIIQEGRKALIWHAMRDAWQFQLGSKDDVSKKDDRLRVAAVLQKVLKADRVDEETKERAKDWVSRMVNDPIARRMFRESSDASIEAFFLMEPDQQQAFYKTIPAPMVNLIYQWLKELQPTLSPETMALLETRWRRAPRTFNWADIVWLAIALMIALMIIRA